MKTLIRVVIVLASIISLAGFAQADVTVSDPNIVYSPYNWLTSGSEYAQSPNPGAYVKVGFTGTSIGVRLDVSPLTLAKVPAGHYPVVRYTVDGGPGMAVQLTPTTNILNCASGLRAGDHTLLLEYIAGYVFLDFWSPVNVLRVTGFRLDSGASLVRQRQIQKLAVLFLGDSITNGDDDIATFEHGITNEVDTQDASIGYPSVVASGIGAEYGVVAYGGASWNGTAADGHTPGLMTFYSMLDCLHSRMVAGKLSPIPDEIYVNMGENSGPKSGDVPKLLSALRAASSHRTHIFVIVPFSGRSRQSLRDGYKGYRKAAPSDSQVYLLDLGNHPYLTDAGPTKMSVDGQHPLAVLHGQLGAQLVQGRAIALHPSKL